jgi:hypothetical protein
VEGLGEGEVVMDMWWWAVCIYVYFESHGSLNDTFVPVLPVLVSNLRVLTFSRLNDKISSSCFSYVTPEQLNPSRSGGGYFVGIHILNLTDV